MEAPSSPQAEPSPPPEMPPPSEPSEQEQLWSSLFPRRPSSVPPRPRVARPQAALPEGRLARIRVRFFRALPGFFENLGAVMPALVAAVLTGVLLGYLLGVTRDGVETARASGRQSAVDDRHERDLVRVQAAAEQELGPARTALDDARVEAAKLRSLTTLYEGMRTAQRALRSLEARHFGDAEATLREAARQLTSVAGDVEGLGAIVARLQRVQHVTAIDLNARRRALLATLAQLDALIDARLTAVEARVE
ncbi:MAG: hypothetical protein ABW252_08320 [Polyangiales bacterium]